MESSLKKWGIIVKKFKVLFLKFVTLAEIWDISDIDTEMEKVWCWFCTGEQEKNLICWGQAISVTILLIN